MIEVGVACSGLYLMQENQDEQSLSKICFENFAKTPKISSVAVSKTGYNFFDLWHFRLSHIPVERINLIHQRLPDVKCTNDLFCEEESRDISRSDPYNTP